MPQKTFACRQLAPEDVRLGDYITIMDFGPVCAEQVLSCPWADDVPADGAEPSASAPPPGVLSGFPARVRAVCLPFVFVKHVDGTHGVWDLRVCRVARLPRRYARCVWRELKPARKRCRQKQKAAVGKED